jgi:hypothetical protein
MPIDDDDYIPFEGPLWDSRGPRQVSEAEAAQLQETLRKIRERQAERHQAAKERVAKEDRVRELVQKLKLNEPGRMRRPGSGTGQ